MRSPGQDGEVAAAIYSGVMTIMSITFSALYRAVLRQLRREGAPLDRATARPTALRFGAGQFIYLAFVGLSFLSPQVVLLGHFLQAAFYRVDQTGSKGLPAAESALAK